MEAYKDFTESLNDLFKSISKEIKTGKVGSHIKLEVRGDVYRLIKSVDGKTPTVKSWQIPQEDRDESITLRETLKSLKEDEPFQKLIKAIRSNRALIHTDEVWKKNVISFMGDEYTLDEFIRELREDGKRVIQTLPQIQKAQIEQRKMIRNKEEQNVALQALFKSLLLKRLRDTKNVPEYYVLRDLLDNDTVVHQVKKSDGSVVFQKESEELKGMLEKSFKSLREYKTISSDKSSVKNIKSVGTVETYKQYLELLKKVDDTLRVMNKTQKIASFNYIAMTGDSAVMLGNGMYEALKKGAKNVAGSRVRLAASYEQQPNDIPVVLNGRLYRNKISAIMSYIESDELSDEKLWELYGNEYAKGGDDRKKLLMNENRVLIQNYDIQKGMLGAMRSTDTIWMTLVGGVLYIHHDGVQKLVLKMPGYATAESEKNANALFEWILSNKNWYEDCSQMGFIDSTLGKNVDSLRGLLDVCYELDLSKSSLGGDNEAVSRALKVWNDNTPVDWKSYDVDSIGVSLKDSLEKSGYVNGRVSVDDLISYVRRYGGSLFNSLKNNSDSVDGSMESVMEAVIMSVFLSLLHPKVNGYSRTDVIIENAKDKITKEYVIGSKERQIVRDGMERNNIVDLEKPVDDEDIGAGARESKEGYEEDYEMERSDDSVGSLRIIYGGGMDMRLVFK